MCLYRYFFHATSGRKEEADYDEGVGVEEDVTSEGEMAEWFRGGNMEVSETESDHDSEDVKREETSEEEEGREEGEEEEEKEDGDDVKMGESEEAREYDENLIFRHLQVTVLLLFQRADQETGASTLIRLRMLVEMGWR